MRWLLVGFFVCLLSACGGRGVVLGSAALVTAAVGPRVSVAAVLAAADPLAAVLCAPAMPCVVPEVAATGVSDPHAGHHHHTRP